MHNGRKHHFLKINNFLNIELFLKIKYSLKSQEKAEQHSVINIILKQFPE